MQNIERNFFQRATDPYQGGRVGIVRPSSTGLKLLGILALVLTAGCGEKPQIRSYVVDAEQEKVITTEVLRNQFPAIPFRWSVPPDWRVADNDQFSVIAWTAGPADSKNEARITLSELPGSAGVLPQIARWRNQIGMPEVEPAEAAKAVETLSLGAQKGSYVELQGPRETILGMIVTDRGKMWIFKYRSENSTASKVGPSFRGFCESLKINP